MPGVWVDYYKQGFEFIKQKLNCNISEPEIQKSVEILKTYNPRVHYREEEYTPEFIFSKALAHWNEKLSMKECVRAFWEGLKLKAAVYPDTIPSLLQLKKKGYLIATLTDLPTAMPDELFRQDIQELLKYFDLYLSSLKCGFRKPNSRGLQMISEYYHVPIPELIFVGDEEKDRKTADNAGCDFILMNRKEIVDDILIEQKEKADGRIHNLYELEKLLELRENGE